MRQRKRFNSLNGLANRSIAYSLPPVGPLSFVLLHFVELKTMYWLMLKPETSYRYHKIWGAHLPLFNGFVSLYQMVRLDLFLVLKQTQNKNILPRKTGKCCPEHHYTDTQTLATNYSVTVWYWKKNTKQKQEYIIPILMRY